MATRRRRCIVFPGQSGLNQKGPVFVFDRNSTYFQLNIYLLYINGPPKPPLSDMFRVLLGHSKLLVVQNKWLPVGGATPMRRTSSLLVLRRQRHELESDAQPTVSMQLRRQEYVSIKMSASVSIATHLADIYVSNYINGRQGMPAALISVQMDRACGMSKSLPLQPSIIKL